MARSKARVLWCAGGILLVVAGCKRPAAPAHTRALNELPTDQLRVVLKGYAGDWRGDSDMAKGLPQPPVAKEIPRDAKTIALPAVDHLALGSLPVREAIAARRSLRAFSTASLTLEELSFLLWSTQGVTGAERDDYGKVVHEFRAAPSAGARYPLETYLSVNRVAGLAAGLYRYDPSGHQLVELRADETLPSKLQAACFGEAFVAQAPVVFVWSAIPYRTEWKYAYISHRMIAIEAGHVCENLYLAAESIGAGACGMNAYHQPTVDQLLGVDGKDEFALYLACVGKRPEATR